MILLLAASFMHFRCPDVVYWYSGAARVPYHRQDVYEGACSWVAEIDDTPSYDIGGPFKKVPVKKVPVTRPWYRFW